MRQSHTGRGGKARPSDARHASTARQAGTQGEVITARRGEIRSCKHADTARSKDWNYLCSRGESRGGEAHRQATRGKTRQVDGRGKAYRGQENC
jgi:hypothetical protein